MALKAFQCASAVLYDLFLVTKRIATCIQTSTAKAEIVRPTITNMAAPWSTRQQGPHHFFSALTSLPSKCIGVHLTISPDLWVQH